MFSPRNDKYNPSYSKIQLTIKCLLRFWFLCYSWFFFAFWGSKKYIFHISPFPPTRYVLKSFRYLKVRNRVRNWNKVKNFIFVVSKLQLCQLEIPIHIYKIICQSTLINSISFLFCEFIRVTSWNDANYYFCSIIISNSQIETLNSYSRSTNVNVNMSFPNSKFEGNFSTYVFGKSFVLIESLKLNVGHRGTHYAKKY